MNLFPARNRINLSQSSLLSAQIGVRENLQLGGARQRIHGHFLSPIRRWRARIRSPHFCYLQRQPGVVRRLYASARWGRFRGGCFPIAHFRPYFTLVLIQKCNEGPFVFFEPQPNYDSCFSSWWVFVVYVSWRQANINTALGGHPISRAC